MVNEHQGRFRGYIQMLNVFFLSSQRTKGAACDSDVEILKQAVFGLVNDLLHWFISLPAFRKER